MTDPRIVAAPSAARRSKRALPWLLAAGAFMIVISPVVLFAGAGNPPCQAAITGPLPPGSGSWIATAYGPPWDAMNGSGVTATGLNLTAGEPAYEIAVDPSVIALGSFERVTPNPFGTSHAFYAGDTGGAIIGRHVDIYDWQGRAAQNAWGVRHVRSHPRAHTRHRKPPRRDNTAGAKPAGRDTSRRRVRGLGRRAAAAHPRAAGEDPRERARRRAERRAAGREVRDRGRQPAHLKALHLRRRARRPAHRARLRLRLLRRHQLPPARRRRVRALRGGLHAARELRPARSRRVDHRVCELGARVHRRRRDRDEHRLVRAGQPDRARTAGRAGSPPPRSPPNTPATSTAGSCNATRTDSDDAPPSHRIHAALAARRGRARRLRDLRPLHSQAAGHNLGEHPRHDCHRTRTRHPSEAARSRRPRAPRKPAWPPTPRSRHRRRHSSGTPALYVNWTADRVAGVQRELASLSTGQARAQALQAAASYTRDQTLAQSNVANSGHLVAITSSVTTPGQWVLVTSEQTSGTGDYAGLPPTLHVIYAQVTRTPSGWVVSEWAPQN